MKRLILGLSLLAASGAWSAEMLVLVGPLSHDDVSRLEREYPLSVDDYRDGSAWCYMQSEDLPLLAGMPWPRRVLIADLQAYYTSRAGELSGRDEPWSVDHTYDETMALLQSWADTHPDICRLVDVGESVSGRTLRALVVSDNPNEEEYEPEVRLIGSIHGNEQIGNEVCLYSLERLLTDYTDNAEIAALVDKFEIWVEPLVNPDGLVHNRRYNDNGVDLNRNLSYQWSGGGSHPFSEPETQAIADYSGGHEDYVPDAIEDNTFVMGLTYHSGAVCVNYVWNYQYERAPDDMHIHAICDAYSAACEESPYYDELPSDYMDWVTDGWDWYETHGDVNDWSYGARGTFDTTVELDNGQGGYWDSPIIAICDANWHAVMNYLEWADNGLHGVCTDADGAPILTTITVGDRDEGFMYNDPTVIGDYWLPLADDTYDITFSAAGYAPITYNHVEVYGEDTPALDVRFTELAPAPSLTLTAEAVSDGVLIRWLATSDYQAFNLYRCDAVGTVLSPLNTRPLPGSAVSFLDLDPSSPARYRLEAITIAGARELYGPVEADWEPAANRLALIGLYPNPATGPVTVVCESAGGELRATVYDLAGRRVSSVAGASTAGRQSLVLPTDGLPDGVYLLRLEEGSSLVSRRFVIAR